MRPGRLRTEPLVVPGTGKEPAWRNARFYPEDQKAKGKNLPSGNGAFALEEPDDKHDQGSDEQEVYIPGDHMKADPANQPQHEQDYEDCPEHS